MLLTENLTPNSSVKDTQKEVILQAINFVERNLEETILIEDIALAFEKSHWYFQRLFRSVIGLSLGHYLRLRRLSEAALCLRNTDQRIIDIAIRFDFGSQEAFTRAFKKFGGINPNEYRENRNYVIREILNRVTPEKLDYFWSGVQREPTIVQVKEKILLGSRADFLSHFEEGSDCKVKIVEHWIKFLGLKKNIADQVGKEIYGVALSDEKDLREKRLSYLACVETSNSNQNVLDFEFLKLPAGTYAVFENKGVAQKSATLMDYVYGIWFPQSNYKRDINGFDFELFDHRYSFNNPESISFLYIPVTKN